MRRWTTILAAILTLALPAATFAATSTGTTAETLGINSTISLTVPAAFAYPGGKVVNSANVTLTAQTDNTTGMTVNVTVNANGSLKITPGSRSMTAPVVSSACQGSGAVVAHPAGYFVDATTVATLIGSSSANASPCTSAWTASVDATGYAPGAYSGALSFSAVTNP